MIKEKILRSLYQLKPFNIQGAIKTPFKPSTQGLISCLICATRPKAIQDLLKDLQLQHIDRKDLEIILLDNSIDGLDHILDSFTDLNIKNIRNTSKEGLISDLRNETLKEASGQYILFLDDDTRLPDLSFLSKSISLFERSTADVILPHGKAPTTDKYPLDSHSFATRCCLYRRSILEKMQGFQSKLRAYEDIDLGIRCVLADANIKAAKNIYYQHPGLYFASLEKPLAIGQSILILRKNYPLYMWIIIYLNALRFLALIIAPTAINRQWIKISLGVLIAPFTHTKHSYKQ